MPLGGLCYKVGRSLVAEFAIRLTYAKLALDTYSILLGHLVG